MFFGIVHQILSSITAEFIEFLIPSPRLSHAKRMKAIESFRVMVSIDGYPSSSAGVCRSLSSRLGGSATAAGLATDWVRSYSQYRQRLRDAAGTFRFRAMCLQDFADEWLSPHDGSFLTVIRDDSGVGNTDGYLADRHVPKGVKVVHNRIFCTLLSVQLRFCERK